MPIVPQREKKSYSKTNKYSKISTEIRREEGQFLTALKYREELPKILEELFWTGYLYRYWHYLTGESSQEIYAQAKAELMKECYLGFHTLDPVMAIEDLKEIHRQESS